jgi:hypothetical protein
MEREERDRLHGAQCDSLDIATIIATESGDSVEIQRGILWALIAIAAK